MKTPVTIVKNYLEKIHHKLQKYNELVDKKGRTDSDKII